MTPRDLALARIKEKFEQAGVPLRLSPRPVMRGDRFRMDPGVMVMDIRPSDDPAPPREVVVLWPGEAHLEVPGVDARRRQLVLAVEERERVISVRQRWFPERWERRVIPADRRAFLVGLDERHLFMARLPRAVGSVANAHQALKPAAVHAIGRHGARVARQGEHFFLPANPTELAAIRKLLARGHEPRPGHVVAQRNGEQVPRLGKPHRAELVLYAQGRQFVRGVIRHPDHHRLRLREWSRPESNAEAQARASMLNVTWVD